MYIPIEILKQKDSLKSFSSKQNNVRIFKDKAVSKKNSPLLYNIEAGLERVNAGADGVSSRKKIKARSSNQSERAKHLLHKINVVRVDKPKDFSIITAVETNRVINNANIANTEVFENTFNKYITATDKFPSAEDPFYKFDDGNLSSLSYVNEKSTTNTVMQPIDMSKLASGMVTLNLHSNYAGKSKYFTIPKGGLL